MKNLFLKIIAIVLFLLVMPAKFHGQAPQFTQRQSTIDFDITEISIFDERVYFMYHLINDGRFDVVNSENEGVFIISADPVYGDLDLKAAFAEFRKQNAIDFSRMDKEQASETALEYKPLLPQEITHSLLMDVYILSRQNNLCANADPFCTDNGLYQFPAGVNAGSGEPGPNYACLNTTPNPAWYYMRIGNPGNINIYMYSTPSEDIDFCCWGPFDDPVSPCPDGLTINKKVSCSYSGNPTETCVIPSSAQTGEYYILVITNYSNHPCDITFSKTGGSGTTDCGIMPPLVNNDGPFCVGDAIHFTARGQQGASYHWTGPNNYNSNTQNPTITNCNLSHAGTYTCTITLDGQSNSSTTDVEVYARPTANFTAGSGCVGQPIQFTSTSTTTPSGQAITSYQWDFGDGQSSTQQNPTHTYTTAGNKSVSLTVGIGNGTCTSTKTQTIVAAAQPVANAGTDTTIIYNAFAQLNGSGGPGSFNYHWEPADKVVNPNAQYTQTRQLTAQQTFTLTVTSPQGGCSDTDEITVYISGSNMTLAPDANPPAICEGSSSQLNAHAGGGSGTFTYSWTPTTGLSNPTAANPTASPTTTTTYTCTSNDGYTTLTGTATVTVNYPETSEETHYICPDDIYYWHGQAYTAEDDYQFDTLTAQGCDKTITLHLHHYPSYDNAHTTTEYICAGDSYTFHGHEYSVGGLYPEHLQTIHGCDSTVWLDLTVYPDNGVTMDSVTVCPEQLPYIFYGEPYNQAGEYDHTDYDIHGCDSLVRLVLSISNYYIPDIEHQHIAYDDTPSFTWSANGQTYTEEGFYIDTLPTQYCEGIFRLDLHFMKAPEPVLYHDTACDSYTWWISGTPYEFEIPQGSYNHQFVQSHFDDLAPYHYEDGRPCKQEYQLHLQMYKTSDHEADLTIADVCNSYTWQFGHNGETETYTGNGSWTKIIPSKLSDYHCDSIVTLTIQNMIYTPEPEIVCTDNGIEWPHHPITATEFNVNKYTFAATDPHSTLSWVNSDCKWSISKNSWPIKPSSDRLTCDVYAMDWTADTIWLTFTAVNPCDTIETRYYLKSSFYDVQDQESYPAAVGIVPNPNDGHMQLRFENLEGRLSVKVFSTTGVLNDSFEVNTDRAGATYDYAMKRLGNGVYFFVITDGKRSVTKKVVIIN